MTAMDTWLEHLRLLNTYCHALDSCDWLLLRSILHEDVRFSANVARDRRRGPDEIVLHGRDAMAGHIERTWQNLSATHHLVSNHHVDTGGDATGAKGSCYIRAYHAGAGERADLFEESLGRFDFETVRSGDGWNIRRWDETIMIMLGTPAVFGH